jgi:hypothetical protein
MEATMPVVFAKISALMFAVGLMAGCALDVLFPRDLCDEIRPIMPSPSDTEDTLRQVAAQAALIREVCGR